MALNKLVPTASLPFSGVKRLPLDPSNLSHLA